MRRVPLREWACLLALVALGCGSSSTPSGAPSGPAPSPTPVPNTVAVAVDGGPDPHTNFYNTLYTDVTVCVPGTADCQTIHGIEVDTGSSGLRILSSAISLSLPPMSGPSGGALAECLQFVNSSTWGTVKTADLQLGGEKASALPIQIIGDPALPKVPSACTNGGFPADDTFQSFGANGLLGVGNFVQDCGPACTASGSSNPGQYYECASPSSCRVTSLSLVHQVSNPVASFASDNNGVVIALSGVSGEAQTLTGSMTFGIGTQANNALQSAQVFTFDSTGNLAVQFNGASLPFSFVDSGSAVLSFPDKNMPTCSDNHSYFCPKQTATLSATIVGANGSSEAVGFQCGNADTLLALNDSAFATVCSPSLFTQANALIGPNSFDFGLPFFFGRTVFTSIEGRSTPGGVGPYVAFR